MPVMFWMQNPKASLGVKIGPVVFCRLLYAARSLIVPPIPSHAFLPYDVKNAIQLRCGSHQRDATNLSFILVFVLVSCLITEVINFCDLTQFFLNEPINDSILKS